MNIYWIFVTHRNLQNFEIDTYVWCWTTTILQSWNKTEFSKFVRHEWLSYSLDPTTGNYQHACNCYCD